MNIGFGDIGDLGVCVVGQKCWNDAHKPAPAPQPSTPSLPNILGPIAGMVMGGGSPTCRNKKGKEVACKWTNKWSAQYGHWKAPAGGTISMSGLSGFDPSNPSSFNPNDPSNTQEDKVAYYKYVTGMDVPSDTKFVVLQPQDDNGVMKFLNSIVNTAGGVAAAKLQADIAKQHQNGAPAIVPVPVAASNTNWAWWGGGVVALTIGGVLLWYFMKKR